MKENPQFNLNKSTKFILRVEDAGLRGEVNVAADRLKSVIAPFVESSKVMAINMGDQVKKLMNEWMNKYTWMNEWMNE